MTPSPLAAVALDMVVANELSELERLAAAVDAWAANAGVNPRIAYQINLVLDEILTNTVSYGYDDDAAHAISVGLSLDAGVVRVRVTDDGKAFDPFTEAPEPDLGGSIDERAIGGLGVHFARTFMDAVGYRRENGRNVIDLAKNCVD